MLEKARSGIYPSCARVGYRNADGACGKRIIVPDPENAPVITDLFHDFESAQYSIKRLAAQFQLEGRTLRGRRINGSLIHQILRSRLYMGDFDWDGMTYQGTHEPLVSRACWERVQELLDARAENKTRKVTHDFAFTGLVHCGHCGCHLVGELKKGRYIYYHCTGNRGKCPEPYTRQEVLTTEFAGVLGDLVIPEPILQWLAEAALGSDRTEQAAREEAIKQLRVRYDRVRTRMETMYLDKLDGRITPEFFDERAAAWRGEQDAILDKIQDAQKATPAPVDQAIDTLQLTSQACQLFMQQSAEEQRRLLRVLIKDATWQDGTLRTALFEPFEILRHSNQESYRKEKEIAGSGQDLEIWLPKTNTYPNMRLEKPGWPQYSTLLTEAEDIENKDVRASAPAGGTSPGLHAPAGAHNRRDRFRDGRRPGLR